MPAPGMPTPLGRLALPGCAKPEGGRLLAIDGDGAACEGVPWAMVCSAGGTGFFTFWSGAVGRAETAVAIVAMPRPTGGGEGHAPRSRGWSPAANCAMD